MAGATPAAFDVAGSGAPWAALGLAVSDERCTIGAVQLRFGAVGAGLTGWTLRGAVGDGPVDGIPTAREELTAPAPGEHPLGLTAVDHVVVRTPDVERTFAALTATGMHLRRERTAGELRQGFFRHGECVVEVVGPARPAGDERARLWGLTFVAADLDAAAARLGASLGEVRPAVQPGRRIATVVRDAGLGVPVALMSA